MKLNYSKQREQIIKCIENSKMHLTAEEIYNELKVSNPKLSLGTVYRNLDVLYEAGLICRISSKNEPDRYDAESRNHYHAKCIRCGKLNNIIMDKLEEINKYAQKEADCEIISHNLTFDTICKKCKR